MSGFEIAALALVAAGTAASAAGSIQSANAQAGATQFNAALTARDLEIQAMLREREQQARTVQIEEEQEGLKIDLQTFDRQAGRFRANQKAIVGASGFELSGSALEVLADTAGEQAFERDQIELESSRRQRRIRDEGLLLGFEADQLRERADTTREFAGFEARNIRRAGGLRAVSSLLGGASSIGLGLSGGR